MISLEDVFIELRTRIRCCNIFLTFDRSDRFEVKLDVKPDGIYVWYETGRRVETRRSLSTSSEESVSDIAICVERFCRLIPNSVSGLKVDGNCVSLRVLVAPRVGSFHNEVVPSADGYAETVRARGIAVERRRATRLACLNCGNAVSGGVRFRRVLELPTGSVDASEWFCHGGGAPSRLSPRSDDLFYRLSSVVVSDDVLSDKFREFNKMRVVYHCDRCLAWLGVKDGSNCAKYWNSTIKQLSLSGESTRLFVASNDSDDSHLADFVYTVRCLIRECSLGQQYSITCKILLECQLSEKVKKFILLWIIEKELQVLHSDADVAVRLTSNTACKLLYLVQEDSDEAVGNWKRDPFVVAAEISKALFVEGLEYLQRKSAHVPESFRKSNGFNLSYIFYR